MTSSSVRTFHFRKDGHEQSIHIPEVLDASYGMYVWPCAPVLSQYIWHNKHFIKYKKVLEIGAGTSLPGILAAKLGATVTLSDASHLPSCLENCNKAVGTNNLGGKVKVIGVTWGQYSPELIQLGAVDVILGSDCFYDTKDFEDIIVTVAYLCDKNPNAEFWTTYQERSADRTIFPLLEKWNLFCRHIPLEDFDAADPQLAGSELPGDHTIHMMVIKQKPKTHGVGNG